MNISKRKQGILAIICTIAMIVTSITVYNPREVKAAASGSGNGMKYTVSGESQEGGLIGFVCIDVQILSTVDGFMHFAWSGADAYKVDTKTIKAQIDGVDVATYNSNPSDTFIAYSQFKGLEAGEHQIRISGTTSVGAKEIYATATLKIEKVGGTAVEKPSAPVGLVAHIDATNTNYTISFAAVAGAESYKFYLNGNYIKDITNGGPKGIVTIEELGLKAGKTYKFGVSAVNAAGESGITTIDVTAPGKEEGTTTPTPGTDERTGNIVQGKIWKAYTRAEDGKGLYEISSDATNYTLKDKNIGSDWWHIQTAIDGVTFYANTDYVCTFTLKADKPKEFTVDNRIGDGKIFVESEGKGWQKAEDGTYFYKYKGTFASTTKQDLNVRIALGYHNGKDKKTDSNYSANDIATFKMSNFQIVKASEYKDDTYTVTINGTKVGSAEPGDTYTLPTEAKYGYYDTVNKVIYKAGSEITVNDDVNLVSITNVSVKMYDGAAIRIAANEKTPGGIRFKASVDVTCGVAEYKNEITNKVQAGTLITTKDILDAKNDVEYNVENVNNIGKVLDVENTGWLDESTHSYSASLINIVKANYDRYFVAKAYVKVPYVKAAAEYVYSADDSGNSCANSVKRSISDVATAIKGNGEYDGITDDTIKKLIDSFIVTK